MDNARDIELIEKRTGFQGWFRINVYRLRHRLYGGGWGKPIEREVFERGHSVAVIPYDPVRDAVVLVEQFRMGPYVAGAHAWVVETIAGIVEDGESIQEVARRESVEEAGCTLGGELIHLGRHFVSPGGTSEHCDLFVGRCDSEGLGGVHGLAEEGEDIKVLVLPFEEARALREQGRVQAGPALIGLYWLELKRAELRRQWGG